jgi:hypothetical protein
MYQMHGGLIDENGCRPLARTTPIRIVVGVRHGYDADMERGDIIPKDQIRGHYAHLPVEAVFSPAIPVR